LAATVTPFPADQSVRWSVNGIEGGNPALGIISTAGQYTAPTPTGSASLRVMVRATSIAQPSLFGEGQVTVPNPASQGALQASLVSVRRGTAMSGPSVALSPPLTVQLGAIIGGLSTLTSSQVSVRRGVVSSGPSVVSGAIVSVTTGPVISVISPGSISRGATVTLNITGENLSGATAIRFLDINGATNANIIASAITASADGTSITATVTVSGSATLGQHIVVVTAPAGTTPTAKAGANTISIQ
jgi:hypothetical protein